MALAGSGDRGELRAAIEGLLRTCVELERHADEMARTSRDQANRVARGLVGLRAPGVSGLAGEIADVATAMRVDVSKALLEARAPYVTEVHQLLGLLAPLHGVATVPALSPPGTVDGLAAAFPAGFARDYVADVVSAVEHSAALQIEASERVQVVSKADADGAKSATGAAFSDGHRDTGVDLLDGPACHAVERHGPQIPDEAQLARLIWLKDPSGADGWQITADGSVLTGHRCGISAGGFTSPEALAKPIEAFLRAAHAQAGGLDEFLTKNTKKKAKVVGIHVSAEIAGLNPGDACGYRGAGTQTKETRRDWLSAREFGIAEGRVAVFGVPFDPITEGSDPGATLVFRRSGATWWLVTCYPVEKQSPTNLRLEDLS
ncbi:hypothetical protein [Jiangella alba]|uniref:Uncharacterized protein n=1 Tax=Jiangella alba TaxID=561176 RepID=A0A1H5PSP5_9ACTN|nr:hypothetical protein [Jiangella alba]SEF16882.1 hypothetical protein SAMN04488561_5587 [Jiangella alba]